ncbi:hypothetical protein SS05631_c05860 [Sinorhizobium sp. CCBAU 05631]|nr:hypothetical protein SS05631_c05860 [Sinorhizobium sp. CCBAU 05631]
MAVVRDRPGADRLMWHDEVAAAVQHLPRSKFRRSDLTAA